MSATIDGPGAAGRATPRRERGKDGIEARIEAVVRRLLGDPGCRGTSSTLAVAWPGQGPREPRPGCEYYLG